MLFRKKKPRTWYTPAGEMSNLMLDMLKQPHLLIAGATGSGKSVLINSLIYTALYQAPCRLGLILIDPKRVELVQYKKLPHTMRYASEPAGIVQALGETISIMENRFTEMQKAGKRETERGHIYVIIDEFADLMTTAKKQTLPQIQRIAQLGRAAHIHLIAATQRPTKDIISGQIKVNMDSRVALRCPTAQDSRNIINYNGAELLPRIGRGYYLTPETMQPALIEIPYTDPEDLEGRVKWWTDQI